jgi:hypothetical protein
MAFFADAVGNFMADLFNEADWMEQADNIWTLRKPKTMTPKQFLSQLQHLVSMLASFPQAPVIIFTENELKRIFLYRHSATWVDGFKNASMMATSKSMGKSKCYMECQAAKEALPTPRQAKNRGNNSTNGNGNNSNSSRRSSGCNRGRGNNRNLNNTSGGPGGNCNTNSNHGGN